MPEIAVGNSTVRYEDFDCFGETRQRVTRIYAAVVRRRKSVARDSTLRPLCMRAVNGVYDRYPDHTEGGHLIGLSIGGEDHGHNLVPMFAGFNQITWKAYETAISKDQSITHVKVVLSYTAAEPRKPAQFYLFVRRNGGNWKLEQYPHMMDQPSPPTYLVPQGAVDILRQAAGEMANWKLEDEPFFDRRCLPDPALRKYAVLDYLLLKKWDDYMRLVNAFGLDHSFYFVMKGAPFTDLQREMVKRVNYILNGNRLRSDTDGTVLLAGSTTHAPQIDHQISMRVSNGYNAYSNALVLGALQNQSKGASRD